MDQFGLDFYAAFEWTELEVERDLVVFQGSLHVLEKVKTMNFGTVFVVVILIE